jgi:LmbE family N-acetylglucosaminyl deacetylase
MWVSGLEPNVFVDITDVFDRKLEALRAHASQVSSRAELDELLRGWSAGHAQVAGWEAGRLAEAFREVDCR